MYKLLHNMGDMSVRTKMCMAVHIAMSYIKWSRQLFFSYSICILCYHHIIVELEKILTWDHWVFPHMFPHIYEVFLKTRVYHAYESCGEMLVMSRDKLLFWDPCCTSRVLLTAYVMSVLRGLPPVCLEFGEIFLFCKRLSLYVIYLLKNKNVLRAPAA